MKRYIAIRRTETHEEHFKCCSCKRILPEMARGYIEGKATKRCKTCAYDISKRCIRCDRLRRRSAFIYGGKERLECQECHNNKHKSVTSIRAERSAYQANRRSKIKGNTGKLDHKSVLSKILMTGGSCYICGSYENIGIDHIKPLKLGGSNLPANIKACCRKCNSAKSDRYK